MDEVLEMRKVAVCSSLRQELERWNKLLEENLNKSAIEASRRKILGYCDELERIEGLQKPVAA